MLTKNMFHILVSEIKYGKGHYLYSEIVAICTEFKKNPNI